MMYNMRYVRICYCAGAFLTSIIIFALLLSCLCKEVSKSIAQSISGTQTAHYPTFLPEYLHSKSILPSSNALIELARSSACCIDNSVSVNSSCCWSTFI